MVKYEVFVSQKKRFKKNHKKINKKKLKKLNLKFNFFLINLTKTFFVFMTYMLFQGLSK